MGVITISRQLGSLGDEVASATAERLGYRLVVRELINQAARRAGAPEAALAAIDELGLLGACPSAQACRAYNRAVAQVIQELAAEGNVVIVGRAGQAVLEDFPSVLHVRVVAPAALRAQRVAARHGISLEAARAQIIASDQFRKRYVKRFFHVAWDDPDLYDIIINTRRIDSAAAAEVLAAALKGRTAPATIPQS